MRNNKWQMTSIPDKTTDELEQIEQPLCAYEECLCNKFQNQTKNKWSDKIAWQSNRAHEYWLAVQPVQCVNSEDKKINLHSTFKLTLINYHHQNQAPPPAHRHWGGDSLCRRSLLLLTDLSTALHSSLPPPRHHHNHHRHSPHCHHHTCIIIIIWVNCEMTKYW